VRADRYYRDYARRALRAALRPAPVRPRTPPTPKYDPKVVAALEKCWAVLNAPAGKRLAPMLGELVPLLRRHGELDLDDAKAELLAGVSAATIDRKLAGARTKMLSHGRSHTKPGSILKSRIAMRTPHHPTPPTVPDQTLQHARTTPTTQPGHPHPHRHPTLPGGRRRQQ
jgi:hypothetical protein